MADEPSRDQKTEAPSERKIDEALRKGNTPTSREVMTLGSVLGMLLAFSFFCVEAARNASHTLARFIEQPGAWRLERASDAVALLHDVLSSVLLAALPFLLVLLVAGLASTFLQGKPQLVLERIKPTPNRISLAKGWKRLFGRQGLVQFGIAACKFLILGGVATIIVQSVSWDIFNSMVSQPSVILTTTHSIVIATLGAMAVAAVFLAIADFSWSRFHWWQELRMTREEVKQEHKQSEGDPLVKARLRSIMRDRSRKRMMARIPDATVVIANPTHYAVALRYKPELDAAPLVLAKGADLMALRIREIAEAHGVPVVEDRLLARPLYGAVELDQQIPPEFYRAVAKIVLYLNAKKVR